MAYFTASDGTRLFYDETGTGLPVLCLSGLTRNHRDFDHMLPHIDARVIRMDYRGRGLSDWPGPATYTVAQEAQDAVALLDHLGIARAGVLGTSRGGLIAMGLGTGFADRVLGVALNDVGPKIGPDFGLIADYLGRDPGFATLEEALAARPQALPGFANVPEHYWRHDIEVNYQHTPEGLRNFYDNRLREAVLGGDWAAMDMWPYFDGLAGLPLALIRGAGSGLLLAETAAEMRARRPDMIYAEVPDRGHIPFLDEPQSVAALRQWIEVMS